MTNTSYTILFSSASTDGGSGDADASVSLKITEDSTEDYADCKRACEENASTATSSLSGGLAAMSGYINCMQSCSDLHCVSEPEIGIKVEKTPSDLNYRLETTVGTLSPVLRVEEEDYSAYFEVALNSSLSMGSTDLADSPALSWKGTVYNSTGDSIKPPAGLAYDSATREITWEDNTVVVGTLLVVGKRGYDYYVLKVAQSLIGDDTDGWSATIRGFYMDGDSPKMSKLVVTEPGTTDGCFGGSNLIVNPDDPDDTGELCWKKIYEVDPCTGETTRLPDEQLECPSEEEQIGYVEGG